MADKPERRNISFRVLGRLSVGVDGTEVPLPRSPVLQGLLGVLVLAEGEALRIDRLTRLVWGDRAEVTSRESVHVAVSRLRKWLERLGDDTLSIDYDDGYRLRFPVTAFDLHRFRELVARADRLRDPHQRGDALVAALELCRGPVLAGLERLNRAEILVRSVEDDIRQAGLDLAATALDTDGHDAAIAPVAKLADEHPFDEPLHAALMELLAASGRPAQALDVHRRLRDRLRRELDVEPSDQVQQTRLRVLAWDRPAAAAEPGARPPTPVPAELPPDIPDFVGRAEEAALLVDVLVRPSGGRVRTVPVAAVAGMGGVGKTALAVHVAHLLAGAFPDGQLYVDLHGDGGAPTHPADVLDRFLYSLGISGTGLPATLDERTALFRSRVADRRVLIVLDNAADEAQVRPLLPGTPNAAVLITSRNRLTGLEGAVPLDLRVFTHEQSVDLLALVVGEERVAAEPDVAAEIARLCGYVPLAVRIAAGRLVGRPYWALSHLAEMLRDEKSRLDELALGDLAVRTSFGMSYRQLPAETRRAFRMTGLLDAPDFALWTVAALLDVPPPEARPHLETLIDAQLVAMAGVDATGELRYRMHDLVRLYARELAAEDTRRQRTAALARALGAWLWLAERAADRVPGPAYAAMHGGAARWPPPPRVAARLLRDPMAWFAAELPALVASVYQACDLRLDELAWDLAASLEKYCDIRGIYDDWRHMHERALRFCRAARNARGEAVLTRGLLEVNTWASQEKDGPAMVRMRESAERLLQMFTKLGDPRGRADALILITWGLVAQGAEEEALATARRALRVAESAGYPGGQARAHHLMAVAYGERRADLALPCLERALAIADQLGNPRLRATIVQFLGAAHALTGDIATGERMLTESIAMARDMDDRYLETFSLVYLAKLFAATGDGRARETAELALSHSHAGNFRHHLADALAVLGELHLAAGEIPAAVARLERSVEVWRGRGWVPFLVRTLRTLADARAAAGDEEAAREARAEADALERRDSRPN
ncbi:BTAD domain-containing putative transcriptional regulator [Actinomadura namibiensis]|uniref:DNA-binding SARP family transcriptional activator/tetratricopeptide (TPR) repeat protein n=1 Tax=Actinomadura namibiensis TaxID=182080 RepID=A0A7W3LWB0_ACTNM|nr:BTAD domain-containing putative transcriptional regulator [Actinomadura namibiensis]MBA8955434.1 DNA-binding SARP family transcriptional activator/tetratricopeptide (TPR) repeat protein [Actinomadura namibiensis]